MMRARVDSAGWPFIGGAAILGALAAAWISWAVAAPFAVLALLFLFFFRDPDRAIAAAPDAVLSPADGRVLVAGAADPAATPPGDWKQVSIFLSPMNVHVNRVPASGRVTKVTYTPGRFLPAYHRDAASANERSELWIDHGGRPGVALP